MRFSSKSKGLGFYLQIVSSLSASIAPSPGTVWEKKEHFQFHQGPVLSAGADLGPWEALTLLHKRSSQLSPPNSISGEGWAPFWCAVQRRLFGREEFPTSTTSPSSDSPPRAVFSSRVSFGNGTGTPRPQVGSAPDETLGLVGGVPAHRGAGTRWFLRSPSDPNHAAALGPETACGIPGGDAWRCHPRGEKRSLLLRSIPSRALCTLGVIKIASFRALPVPSSACSQQNTAPSELSSPPGTADKQDGARPGGRTARRALRVPNTARGAPSSWQSHAELQAGGDKWK